LHCWFYRDIPDDEAVVTLANIRAERQKHGVDTRLKFFLCGKPDVEPLDLEAGDDRHRGWPFNCFG
jgi:hypothetical protein